jgi:predicted Zn-dependent peptidase
LLDLGAAKIPPRMYHLSVLPNGLRVATAEMPHMASVCIGLWAGVGSRHESARLNGAAHFLEHLLFKGTRRRTARRISGEVEALGGYLDAFTSEDHTCYFAKAEAARLPALADVLADLYQHSQMPPIEVERERGVIREEIMMYRDQPAQVAEELLAAAMWPAHPLGRPLAGTEESLAALRREDLLAFWRTGYHARSSVLAVAGNIRHADVLTQVAPLLAALPTGRQRPFARWRAGATRGSTVTPRRTKQRAQPPASAPRVVVDRRDSEQVQLALGFVAPGRHDPNRFATRVLSALLGEKMDSRLFQSLRERRGLCYSVQSDLATFAETGLLSISAGLEAKHVPGALRLIRQELDRLCAEPVGVRELREARDYLIGQHRLGLESTTNQMMWLGESVLGHGRVIDPEEITRLLGGVDAAAIQAAACACGAGFRALVAVGPLEHPGEELLEAFASVPARPGGA